MITLRLGSSARTRKIWLPPMPSSGLGMTSPFVDEGVDVGRIARHQVVG